MEIVVKGTMENTKSNYNSVNAELKLINKNSFGNDYGFAPLEQLDNNY